MTYILTKGLDSSLDLSRPAVAMKHKTILPDLIVTIAIGYFTHTTHTETHKQKLTTNQAHTSVSNETHIGDQINKGNKRRELISIQLHKMTISLF